MSSKRLFAEPFAFCDFFRCSESVPVSGPIFSAQRPRGTASSAAATSSSTSIVTRSFLCCGRPLISGLAQSIGSDLIDRSAIDRRNSHRDYGSGLENPMSSRANQRINRRSLIFLHIEENEIGIRRVHAHVELFEEIRLHEVER